eukprot:gene463-862_t
MELKANVTEENGEISCSIEETNRIRLALGLKPLQTTKHKEQEAVDNFQQNAASKQKQREENELKDRLEKAKNKRLLHAKLDGAALSEVNKEEDKAFVSAADWVRRSRNKELSAKEKSKLEAELHAKRLQEEEEETLQNLSGKAYTSSDLSGLKLMHGTDDFDIGESMILTLADSSVLEKDEHGKVIGINDNEDILENVNLAEKDRRLDREKTIKRTKQPVYAGYDDLEFAEGMVPGTRPNILPQYDIDKKSGPKLVLGEGGHINNNINDFSSNMVNEKQKIPLSLQIEKKEISDYYTKTEFSTFSKLKNNKKKRKIRKKEDDNDNDEDKEVNLEQTLLEAGAMDISNDLSSSTSTDRGSRAAIAGKSANKIAQEDAKRKQSYDQAVKLAEEKVQKVFPTASSKTSSTSSSTSKAKNDIIEDDDDAEISMALERARRLALATQKQKQQQEEEDEADLLTDKGQVEIGLDAEGRKEDGTLVFTSTTEFTARLQARLNERARTRAEAIVKEQERLDENDLNGNGTSTSSNTTSTLTSRKRNRNHDENDMKSKWKDLQRENRMDIDGNEVEVDVDGEAMDMYKETGGEDDEDDEEEEDDEQLAFVHKQPLVASGMAATLALLKTSGDLTKKDALAGRSNDYRGHDPSGKEHGVKLEYRDEYGRKLTQKEAFRQLSYRFHGHGPGQKKKEKRLKAIEIANKSATSRAALDSGTMLSLTRAQEATGKAHLTIQGGVNSTEMAQAIAKRKAKADKEKQGSHKSSKDHK